MSRVKTRTDWSVVGDDVKRVVFQGSGRVPCPKANPEGVAWVSRRPPSHQLARDSETIVHETVSTQKGV